MSISDENRVARRRRRFVVALIMPFFFALLGLLSSPVRGRI